MFLLCSRSIRLDQFDWAEVRTNVLINATNLAASSSQNQNVLIRTSLTDSTIKLPVPDQIRGGRSPDLSFTTGGQEASQKEIKPPFYAGTLQARHSPLLMELTARLFWASSALIFGFLSFVVVAQGLRIADRLLGLGTWSTLFVAAVIAVGFITWSSVEPKSISNIGGGKAVEELVASMENANNPLFGTQLLFKDDSAGITSVQSPPIIFPPLQQTKPSLIRIRAISGYLAVLSKLGILAIAFTSCIILFEAGRISLEIPSHGGGPPGKNLVDDFERASDSFLSLLQLAAATLVGGVFQVYLLYTLSSFHVHPLLQSEVRYHAQVLATIAGVVYSGMLIAVYLPCMSGLKETGRQLLVHGAPIAGGNTPLLMQINDPAATPIIKTALTILSPLLAALVTQILTSAINHVF